MTWFMAEPHRRAVLEGQDAEPGAHPGIRGNPGTPFPACGSECIPVT